MTNSPKKHIIDSLLREIYGEKSPPDQTDAILRRLESGDSTLLSETRTESYANDSGPFPAVELDTSKATPSRFPNWMVVAATVVLCVGLIGAVAKVLLNPAHNDQLANENREDNKAEGDSSSVKHSDSLAVKKSTVDPANSKLAKQDSSSDVDDNANGKSSPGPARSIDTNPLPANPLPVFAENATRLDLLKVKSRIDSSLNENWHVNVIVRPQTISRKEWFNRLFKKIVGRLPEEHEAADRNNYLKSLPNDDSLPSTEIQLRLIESLMTDEATSREFAHNWADRFLQHLAKNVAPTNSTGQSLSVEEKALKSFLRQAFNNRQPLDEIVHDLLTANGSVDAQAIEYSSAAGFVALTGNDPNSLAENISRSFLGTELACARCHSDLVFEQSRTDYLGLAAFLQGTNVTRKPTGVPVVSDIPTKRKVPGLFYSSRSGIAVYAAPLIAGHDANLDQNAGRVSLADQLIRSDRFAKAMVDWVWTEIYGYGLARKGKINQVVNAPHQPLLAELSEQLVANDFDFRVILKWALLSESFAAKGKPSPDTLTKDIPKYGGVAFFSYLYEQLEHDPVESVDRLAKAYTQPEGLSTASRISLNVKRNGKGIEIIDQMENGVLPNGLKVDDEIPEFARGWGVESTRVVALDRIAASQSLTLDQKIEHLYRLALQRAPTKAELKKAISLFENTADSKDGSAAKPVLSKRTQQEVLQDLWWAICPR